MRIKYSRDFLLAVGGSEACRWGKPLPADMHASVLIMAGMQLWSMDPTTATADQLQAKTSTETGDEEARGGDGTAAGSSDGAPEPDALQIGVRSKSKACTGFFSTAGCRSGENCLFVHNITVDYQTVADVRVLGSPTTPAHPPRSIPTGPPVPDGPPTPTVQAAPCNSAHTERELDKPSTAGCCYGEKCRFIHNFPGGYQAAADPPGSISLGPAVPDGPLTPTDERELGKHMPKDNSVPPLREQRPTDHCTPQQAPTPGMASAASSGASATAKISVDASLTGVIIGRGGVNIKQISRASGAKVCIRDHESDTNLKNVELQGTFDQIKNASTMVMELIGIGGSGPSLSKDPAAGGGGSHRGGGPGGSFKTKLCGHFARGLCTHGDGCSFAHGVSELRKLVVSPRDRSDGW